MASIHKDPRGKSPFWYCAYRLPGGKRVFRSTKLTERKAALQFCRKIEQAGEEAVKGRLTEARAHDLISEILEHATGEPLRGFKVRDWLNHWLDMKEQVRAGKTLDRYRQVIRDFLASLGQRGDLWLHQITSRDILTYRSAITAAGKTARTANLSIKVVSAAFNAALRQHITDKNPCTALENLGEHTEERDAFTPAQVSKLVQAAESDWKGAILLGYYTGARLSDVANMHWSAIDWQKKTLQFTPSKTKKPLAIPLHPQLERELRKNPGIGKAPIFPTLAEKDTGGRFGLSGRFAAIMEKAGIEGKHTQASGGRMLSSLSFHSLRHSFASAMANAGVAPEVRMKLTGHSDKDVHASYTHHELETLRAAVAHIPSVKP
jgi:integrase